MLALYLAKTTFLLNSIVGISATWSVFAKSEIFPTSQKFPLLVLIRFALAKINTTDAFMSFRRSLTKLDTFFDFFLSRLFLRLCHLYKKGKLMIEITELTLINLFSIIQLII